MSSSGVDLPDPLGQSAHGAAASADDLLAQLAGEEIDRLLSEAEDGTGALSPTNADHPPNQVDAALNDLYDQLNQADIPGSAAAASATPRATPVAAPEPAASAPAADPTQVALDDLFAQLQSADLPAGTAKTQDAPTAPPQPSPSAPIDEPAAAETLDDAEVQALLERAQRDAEAEVTAAAGANAVEPPSAAQALAAEMDADDAANAAAQARMRSGSTIDTPAEPEADVATTLDAVAAADAAADAAHASATIDGDALEADAKADQAADDEAEATDAPLPLLVRVLQWLNAPLAGLSDTLREALGKIAVITTLNAVAVLVYVLIFRK